MIQFLTTVLLTLVSAHLWAASDIGSITALNGSSELYRQKTKIDTRPALGVESYDDVRTGNGRLEITFKDDSKVRMTEQSKLIIDEFVYDGNPKTSKMSMRFAQGTARFVTGQLGKIDKQNIKLDTPTATIAVRGTDFTTTVDEFGRSLVILLPEPDGTVGEITVSNQAGFVIMNKAFQATMVTSSERMPTDPKTILGLDINSIDNMLIVTPPKEISKPVERTDGKKDMSVTFFGEDALKKDYLSNADFNRDELKTTATIDFNAINNTFFEDFFYLNQDTNQSGGMTKGGVTIQGTSFGMDKTTQINTVVEDPFLVIFRQLSQTFELITEKTSTATINLTQNNKSYTIILNNGTGGTVININQGN